MADDVTLPGTGDVIAADDDGARKWQYVKAAFGPDNTYTRVTTSVGMPTNVIDAIGFAAEGGALGEGVLLQGDDGTDRKNVAVDATTGAVYVSDGGGSITVDTGTPATGNTELAKAEDVASAAGDVGIMAMTIRDDALAANAGVSADGDFTYFRVDNTGALWVNNGLHAHDGATLGNPSLSGARATNSVEGVTQVANADLTHIQADLNGVLLSRPHTTLEEIVSERVSDTTGTSTAFTNFAAGGAGIHNYVTTISIYNASATDGYVDFRDGTAGAIIFTAAAPAAGGSVINLPVPLKGAANTALAYDVSGALTTVYISVVGYQAQG